MIKQASLANFVVVVHISREMGSMVAHLRLSSAYRSSSDCLEKPAAVEPPDLPPLDIDDLPSKAHDSAPPSVNDQVSVDFRRDGKPRIPSPDKNYPTLG